VAEGRAEAVVDTVPDTVAFPDEVGVTDAVPHSDTVGDTEGLPLTVAQPEEVPLPVAEGAGELVAVAVPPASEGEALPLLASEGVPPSGLADGQPDTEGDPEAARDSVVTREALAPGLAEPLAAGQRVLEGEALGERDSRELLLPETDTEGLPDAAGEAVAEAAEEAERDAPPRGEPLGLGDRGAVREPRGEALLLSEAEWETEGVAHTVPVRLTVRVAEAHVEAEGVADSEAAAEAEESGVRVALALADSQRLPVVETVAVAAGGEGDVEALGEVSREAVRLALGVSRLLAVGEALAAAEREEERDAAAEAVAHAVAEPPPAVEAEGQGVTVCDSECALESEPLELALGVLVAVVVAELHAVAEGVGEVVGSASVALGECEALAEWQPLGDAAREEHAEAEAEAQRLPAAEAEGEDEPEGLAEAVREACADAVAERVAGALPESVPDAEMHAVGEEEKLALPDALGHADTQLLPEGVLLRERERVPDVVTVGDAEAHTESLSVKLAEPERSLLGEGAPVAVTVAVPLLVGASAVAVALTEAQPETLSEGEAESEGAALALEKLAGEGVLSGEPLPLRDAEGVTEPEAGPVADTERVAPREAVCAPLAHAVGVGDHVACALAEG